MKSEEAADISLCDNDAASLMRNDVVALPLIAVCLRARIGWVFEEKLRFRNHAYREFMEKEVRGNSEE